MTTEPPPRRRNAAATRAAILASARRAFARAGYDGAGVREIAQGAGVTAMLVNRYFGSKEELFAEVVADTMATPDILTEENLAAPDFAARIAATLVDITTTGATPLDGFLIMMHSASSERAAEIAREQIDAHYQQTLSEALRGDLAAERAALILAVVAGVQVMRQVIALPALAGADPAALREILAPIFHQLVAGSADR
jgi:AcrR family transcriptional regulator